MNRVVIVARTRMYHDHVCLGGYDLDSKFRPVRLLTKFGDHFTSDSPFGIGQLWQVRYIAKVSARPPHVEDVFAMEYRHVGEVEDLKELVLQHVHPWSGTHTELFDGLTRMSGSGSCYVPEQGPLPRRSTGYWVPDTDLKQQGAPGKRRMALPGENGTVYFAWVGLQDPPAAIEKGSLVRLSLSRLFKPDTAAHGYYVQISGTL